jgi:PASTA domain
MSPRSEFNARLTRARRARARLTVSVAGRALLALILAVVLVDILPSIASASVTAYPKPAFTKTAGNATFAFHWTNRQAGNGDPYWLCGDVFVGGDDVDPSNYLLGPGSQNCSDALTASSGDWIVQPFDASTVLQDGVTYDTCVFDIIEDDFVDFPYAPACVATTIDRDTPTLQVVLGGAAASTANLSVPVRISYSSPVSPPWQSSGGVASNWDCTKLGSPCSPSGSPDAGCSHPTDGSSRTTSFSCTLNLASTAANGTYYFCVVAADDAVPDNPNSTNQFLYATPTNANLSAPTCGHITLDREATGGGGGTTGGTGGTAGGHSSRCVVPKVVGRSLASAKALIKRHDCRLGRVANGRDRHAARGYVIAQRPPAGRILAARARINVVIAR